MISAIWAFIGAALSALALTPVVRTAALRLGAVDRPGGRRVNERITPRLGGIGIAVAFYAPLAVLFVADTAVAQRFFASYGPSVGLLVGGLLMCLVGVLDDTRGLRARHKLLAQLAAAGVAYATGFRIEALSLPFIPHLELGLLSPVATALWIVAVINAINLIDGLDGLAGGVTFFACAANFVVAFLNHDPHLMLLSAALGGAVFGFLFFNFNPASIFMGDSGSLFLGYILATTSILSASVKSTTTVSILVPLVALGLPLMDTLLAILRRLWRRQSIFAPDRGHIHHMLLSLGLTHRRAVTVLYSFCVFLTVAAIALATIRQREVGIALAVLTMISVGVVLAASVILQAVNRHRTHSSGWSASVDSFRRIIPEILQLLSRARTQEEVVAALRKMLGASPLCAVELVGANEGSLMDACRLFGAEGEVEEATSAGHLVTTYLPLPAAGEGAELLLQWVNDEPKLSSEAAVLLQLVVDGCDAALERARESQPVVSESPQPRKTAVRSELGTTSLMPTQPLLHSPAGRTAKS